MRDIEILAGQVGPLTDAAFKRLNPVIEHLLAEFEREGRDEFAMYLAVTAAALVIAASAHNRFRRTVPENGNGRARVRTRRRVDLAMKPEPFVIWTLYDHPADYPDAYVARRFEVGPDCRVVPTGTVVVSTSLVAVRESMAVRGLTLIARARGDDPCIIEAWI
jgi:hypothetical protein